jgi:cytochrome c oxidase subunit 2
VVVVLLMALRRRHDGDSGKHENAPVQQGGGRAQWQVVSGVRWIYIGAAITVVVLLVSFGGTLVSIANASYIPTERAPITLDVVAHQWWWEVRVRDSLPSDEFVTANEVHVPVGVPVHVQLHSDDVIHSFWVPELAGKMDVIPGQSNETWLRANRAGVYRGACAEFCGLQHAHMAFAVIADPPAQYAQWAARQRMSAVAPQVTGQLQEGAAVFQSSCGACHAVRGSDALGRLGPDLTHVASRLTIAAGMYDNTAPNLDAWIRDAQAMKPGVLMPVMDLHQRDVAAVVAYLQTLR